MGGLLLGYRGPLGGDNSHAGDRCATRAYIFFYGLATKKATRVILLFNETCDADFHRDGQDKKAGRLEAVTVRSMAPGGAVHNLRLG